MYSSSEAHKRLKIESTLRTSDTHLSSKNLIFIKIRDDIDNIDMWRLGFSTDT